MRSIHRSTLILAGLTLILAATPPAAHAAEPLPVCKSAIAKTQALPSRLLLNRPSEYYGRYEMWTPIGNPNCTHRQILFTVDRLTNDDHPGQGDGPVIMILVQHGLFHRRATDMTIYNVNAQFGKQTTTYTVDAEAAGPRKGAYYAKISVIGKPLEPMPPSPTPK